MTRLDLKGKVEATGSIHLLILSGASQPTRSHVSIMSIGSPANVTCKLVTFAEAKFFVKDLRAGKLRNSILGHDRPIHSCCWDETSGSWLERAGWSLEKVKERYMERWWS